MSYSARVDRAVGQALELHREQRRKGTDIPYVTHLFAVASLVGESGGSEDEVIAALLHDAVEDQGGADTLARIRADFGAEVARIVEACSDTDVVPKPPWRARKQAYLERLAREDHAVLLVSCCDKLHNVRCTLLDLRHEGLETLERFNGGVAGTLWYYRELAAIYERRLHARVVGEFRVLVDGLHEQAGVDPATAGDPGGA